MAEQRNQAVTQGRHHAWRTADVYLAAIFAQGFVAYIVTAILNGPVIAPEVLDEPWAGQTAIQAGQAVARLAFNLTRAKVDTLARPAHDLRETRPLR